MSTTTTSPNALPTARALRSLYFTRTAFSVIWVTLVALFAKSSPGFATMLLIIYPAWDVVGTLLDIRANKQSGTSLMPQYINAGISIVTTIAVAIAIQKGVPQALIVFGIWAILTGVIQLVLGLKRRIALGGQWPMILSGGQSTLAGVSFIVMAHAPTMGIVNLAGYSAFGAFYYLLSAIRLNKTIKKELVG
ncbi:hypothetical protein [Mucilaginibacter terrae]|uniref:Uncharacterized membrane protein HdeD (DUF308 family) n=1 Tax=Mucilaginibacter terrae TaxID=1955052 RepID=A0ABU3GV22_9SPHI|nr:hypothetical protein [Mucilaginibacter terrae]MDT3403623.1 uncharacterized membrane protein HdeD (DUF308 family) [Mucilaginibacter terrae]